MDTYLLKCRILLCGLYRMHFCTERNIIVLRINMIFSKLTEAHPSASDYLSCVSQRPQAAHALAADLPERLTFSLLPYFFSLS